MSIYVTLVTYDTLFQLISQGGISMFDKKRIIILIIIAVIGFVLGRLAVRAVLNLLLGGTLFGGNILWAKRREEKVCLSLYVF